MSSADLSQFHIFNGLSSAELQNLAAAFESVDLPAQTEFIKQSDTSREVYLIMDGRVQVTLHLHGEDSDVIATLGKNETVGEFALVREGRRSASAKTLGDVKVLKSNSEKLTHLFDTQPRIGYIVYRNLARIMVERLQDTNMFVRRLVMR